MHKHALLLYTSITNEQVPKERLPPPAAITSMVTTHAAGMLQSYLGSESELTKNNLPAHELYGCPILVSVAPHAEKRQHRSS